MTTIEIILTSIILVLVLATLIVGLLALRKPKSDAGTEVFKRLDDLKTTVSTQIFDSIMKFNDQVNQKLIETNQKSGDNITDFRLNVNKELGIFKDEIRTKLTADFQGLTTYLDGQMGKINQNVESRLTTEFTKTNQTFIQIAERVKVIDEAQKKIEVLSTEMVGLQNILSNNQSRGLFGEYQLNQLLESVFEGNRKFYDTQFTIREARGKAESVRADAVIFMPEPNGTIAIDSKSPFAEYRKLFDNKDLTKEVEEKTIHDFGIDVKKHINDIATKYIIPGVTADFALMFVASDGILALLHAKLPQLIEHARSKKVTIVSPTTLVPLLASFKAFRIDYDRNKHVKLIMSELNGLKKEFEKFDDEWRKLNESIAKLAKQSGDVNGRVGRITDKFGQIHLGDLEEKTEETSPSGDASSTVNE